MKCRDGVPKKKAKNQLIPNQEYMNKHHSKMIRTNYFNTKQKEFTWLAVGFFSLAFIYFYFVGNYLFSFQANQHLFIYTSDYLELFLIKPGGVIAYLGRFLTQFYSNQLTGSLLLSAVITLPSVICIKIGKKLNPDSSIFNIILFIPSCILLLMQTHYYHLMEYNIGILIVLLYILLYVSLTARFRNQIFLILIPGLYYIAGAFFLLFLLVSLTLGVTLKKGMRKLLPFLYASGGLTVSVLLFKNLILLEPYQNLVMYPLPFIEDHTYKLLTYSFTAYLFLFPLTFKHFIITKPKDKTANLASMALSGLILMGTLFILIRNYNPQTVRVLQMEKFISEERWNEAIHYQENHPSGNLIGQYLYNIALSETNQLTDRLFFGRQDFNAHSLILPWNNEHLNWGVHFFYSAGLINEAHRWAYEEMVVYGPRPGNVNYLIKTNIINGNYREAEVFIRMLSNTLLYKGLADKYETLLKDTLLINRHPILLQKREMMPLGNFYVEVASPQNNLPLLLQSNPKNKKAFEYKMAWFLLTKDVPAILTDLNIFKDLKYKKIPHHIEEAILASYNSNNTMPELYGYTISEKTQERFKQYVTAYNKHKNNPSQLKLRMEENFSNTFWYYFHFM
jgi:hypothetical protein